MAVRQIDRPQRSTLGLYPVGQLRCLRVAEKGIDQQRITLTPDEGDGVRNPGQRFLAGKHALGGAAALPDEKFPVKRRVSRIRGFHWRFTLSRTIRDRPRTNTWMRDGAYRHKRNSCPEAAQSARWRRSTGRGVKVACGQIDEAGLLQIGESGS